MEAPRWGVGARLFVSCVVGGAVIGIVTVLIYFGGAWTRVSYLYSGPLFWLALGVATIFGLIIGSAVGAAVLGVSALSFRLNGKRAPGIVAAVIGSCLSLWLLMAAVPGALIYFATVAAVSSVGLVFAARFMDRRELAFENARVRSLHDVDSSETP